MTDRSRRRAAPSATASREDNPFAAPPEGQPDQPWQPRRGAESQHGPNTGAGPGTGKGTGTPGGSEGSDGSDGSEGSEGSDSDGKPSAWGSQWSDRQPGRQSGGFGGNGSEEGNGFGNGNGNGPGNGGNGPSGGGGPGGGGSGSGSGSGPGGSTRGMRWDPTDPLQRHARYSLHTGIWALFFALFSLPPVALLLGALSLYWGISALRAGDSGSRKESSGKRRGKSGSGATAADVSGSARGSGEDTPQKSKAAPPIPVSVTPAQAAKSRTTAAVSGLITASLSLAVVAATFTFQTVYSDYYACTKDALTQSSRADCKNLLPSELRPLLKNR